MMKFKNILRESNDSEKLYHGTTIDQEEEIVRIGLHPSVGAFVKNAYGYEIKTDEEAVREIVSAADVEHLSAALTAIRFHVGKKLHKTFQKVTVNDVARHGLLVVLDKNGFEYREDDDDNYFGQYPLNIEPGDYYSDSSVESIGMIKGKDLIAFMQAHGKITPQGAFE